MLSLIDTSPFASYCIIMLQINKVSYAASRGELDPPCIKKLSTYENKTILISSHNLPELYQVATDFIMIHEGEIRQVLSHEELDDRCRCYISLEAVNVNQLTAVLEEKLHTQNFQVMPDNSVKMFDFLDERERVGQILHENDVIITKISVCETSLEDYFMNVIG